VVIDDEKSEARFKIVYYGPGLAGKWTNLRYIYERTGPDRRSEWVIARDDAALSEFTISPETIGPIAGRAVRFVFPHENHRVCALENDATPRIVEKVAGNGVEANSQRERLEANIESMEELVTNLRSHGRDVADVPLVIQYNKRDLPNAAPVAELEEAINSRRAPCFEATAHVGAGVFDTLKASAKLIVD
jgi:hypothetical protein